MAVVEEAVAVASHAHRAAAVVDGAAIGSLLDVSRFQFLLNQNSEPELLQVENLAPGAEPSLFFECTCYDSTLHKIYM